MDTLEGKTILVTGSTDGIGKETATRLAAMGARVLIHGRNRQRVEDTREEIRRLTGRDNLGAYQADFSSLAEVSRMAEEVLAQEARLDVLVNNAGIHSRKPALSVDGYELTFAINHLGPFLLTVRLLDRLKESAPARIVVVSSTAHQMGRMDYENLRTTRHYHAYTAYARSKLANVLFTYYLAELLDGSGVTANCLHPGTVNTKLLHSGFPFTGGISVEAGAATSVYVASSPEVEGVTGKYFERQKPVRSSPITYNKDEQQRLWTCSLEAVIERGYYRQPELGLAAQPS